jgi:ribosomal-protein-alanine N-acetyltransferase
MVVLHGDGFCLRPYRTGDADALRRAGDNPAIAQNLAAGFPSPYTLADAETWIASCLAAPDTELRLAITIDDTVNGGIGLYPRPLWSPYTYEMGYWLTGAQWGRGIVSAAVRLVVAHAFEAMNAERVQAFVYDWNPASGRVLEKNGFALEGRLRRAVHRNGRWGDCLAYGRLRVPG